MLIRLSIGKTQLLQYGCSLGISHIFYKLLAENGVNKSHKQV